MFLKKSYNLLRNRQRYLDKEDNLENTRKVSKYYKEMEFGKPEIIADMEGPDGTMSEIPAMTSEERVDYDTLREKRFDNNRLTVAESSRLEKYSIKIAFENKNKQIKTIEAELEAKDRELEEMDRRERNILWVEESSILNTSQKHTSSLLKAYINNFKWKLDNHGKKYMEYDRNLREAEVKTDGGELYKKLKDEWEQNSGEIMDLTVLLDLLTTNMSHIESNYKKLKDPGEFKPMVISYRQVILRLKEIHYTLTGTPYEDTIAQYFGDNSSENSSKGINLKNKDKSWGETIEREGNIGWKDVLQGNQIGLTEPEKLKAQMLWDRITEARKSGLIIDNSEEGDAHPKDLKKLDLFRRDIDETLKFKRIQKHADTFEKVNKLESTIKYHKKQLNNLMTNLALLENDKNKQARPNKPSLSPIKQRKNVKLLESQHNLLDLESSSDEEDCDDYQVNMKVYKGLKAKKKQESLSEKEHFQLMSMELKLKLDLEERTNKILREKDQRNRFDMPITSTPQLPYIPQPGSNLPQYHQSFQTEGLLQPNVYQQNVPHQNQQQFQQHPLPLYQSAPQNPQFQAQPKLNLSLRDANALKIPKFNGGKDYPKHWGPFWRSFNSIVHTQNFPDELKLNILISSLDGKAKEAISVAGTEMMPYQKAIERLKKKYSNVSKSRQYFLNELAQIQMPNPDSIEEQKLYYEEIENIRAVLNDSGIDDEGMRLTIIQNMMQNLGSSIHTEILRHHRKKALDEIPLNDILEVWEQQISYLDRGIPEEMGFNKPKHFSSGQRDLTFMVNTNNPVGVVTPWCAFCPQSTDHWSQACPNVTTYQQRYQILKDNVRCLICLGRKHATKDCPSQRSCFICQGKHHTSIHDTSKVNSKFSKPPP